MLSIESTAVPRAALRVSEACSALAISRSKLYLELAAGRPARREVRPPHAFWGGLCGKGKSRLTLSRCPTVLPVF